MSAKSPLANEMRASETYTFKYETDSSGVELDVMLLSQLHFGRLLNEIKQEVAPDTKLSIKIMPLERGSVPFAIEVDVSWISSLLNYENLKVAGTMIGIVVGVINLKKALKKKKPESVIENNNGNVTIINGDVKIEIDKAAYDIYMKNPAIDMHISKAFEQIEKDDEVTGIKVQDAKKNDLVTVDRQEFNDMAYTNEAFEQDTKSEIMTNVYLTIFKVVFGKGYKWEFYLEGRKISASIKDSQFLENMGRGEKFAQGEKIVADLEISKVYDSTLGIYLNKEYSIIKVHNHLPREDESQTRM